MRVAYVEPISGASGDMILGALLDAGLPLDALVAALRSLPLPDWELRAEPVRRGAIGCTLARVISTEPEPPHRHLEDVLRIIEAGNLPGAAASQARDIFTRLAQAEAHVHREGVESVHFHEVGAADAILDICGATAGLALLGVEHLYCNALPLGSGMIESAHGLIPLPAPATLELLARAGAPTVPHPAARELVTPTGAAILTTLAHFGRPPMTPYAVGYGAGSRTTPEPNCVRLTLGESAATSGATEPAWDDGLEESLIVLECNIDDMNPQWYAHLFERLLEAGAVDVTCSAVLMKKGRPGQLLGVLCRPETVPALTALLLGETTTLGVRRHAVQRHAAERAFAGVETPYGPITVKLRIVAGLVTGATPEYEDCHDAAHRHGASLASVSAAAQAAAYPLLGTRHAPA